MGYITYLHGQLYHQEYGYTLAFEAYVAAGLAEFNRQYDSKRNRGLGGGAQRQNGGLTAAYGPQ
ncbi:hypothetical protein [Rufibacter aurantiacus]|uniref:hypothetical protein n=1 Tax=Rufibacter aurantiacus TaxID=2817374 RepID=UPI001B303C3A|nr:hypothetical protein [Rufibacter aurantiacus]